MLPPRVLKALLQKGRPSLSLNEGMSEKLDTRKLSVRVRSSLRFCKRVAISSSASTDTEHSRLDLFCSPPLTRPNDTAPLPVYVLRTSDHATANKLLATASPRAQNCRICWSKSLLNWIDEVASPSPARVESASVGNVHGLASESHLVQNSAMLPNTI